LTDIRNGELFSRAMIRQSPKSNNRNAAALFRIRLLPWPVILAPVILMALAMMPLPAWSQFQADTIRERYDSIQDARMERMEWRSNRRFNRLEEVQQAQREALDSMALVTEGLRQQLEHLERRGQIQSEKLSMLEEELESSRRSSLEYRDSLQRFLWVSGMLILLLIGLSFLILLLFGMKTRHLVERLRWKQKQVNRELAGEIEHQEKLFFGALQAQKDSLQGELKAHKRESKRTIRKALQRLNSGKRKRS
jgi:hypothetical protein